MSKTADQPNVILIMMDDLCYGDIASHGNPDIQTPHLDAMREQSSRLTQYYSGPLCSPARASIMTGRYHLRTRVVDTYCGRSMMDPHEKTLAQELKAMDYNTGCFGKWHLGDNAPNRPQDLGFDKVLMHKGGGIGQPGDHPMNIGRDSYFDPYLYEDGTPKPFKGYCTDIFTNATLEFMEQHQNDNFFAFLATNAPHTPLQISDTWADPYRAKGLPENHARIYGMIENIDWNVGRIFQQLKALNLYDNTLVIFTSDHGPCPGARATELPLGEQDRFNCGLRGIKGSMYEGGIKVPSFWHLPTSIKAGQDLEDPTHAIDVLPTVLAICGKKDIEHDVDGSDLSSYLCGKSLNPAVNKRSLFMQWHRGDAPIQHRNRAVIAGQHKLVRCLEQGKDELYDLKQDPFEQCDIAAQNQGLVQDLKNQYETWFEDVSHTRPNNYDAPPIHIGSAAQATTELTQQDWRIQGKCDGWDDHHHHGHWELDVKRAGEYDFRLRFKENMSTDTNVVLKLGDIVCERLFPAGSREFMFKAVSLPLGTCQLEAWASDAYSFIPVFMVDITAIGVEL